MSSLVSRTAVRALSLLLLLSCAACVRMPLPYLERPGRYTGELDREGLDPTTGLHVTGSAPSLDSSTWRLRVTGRVGRELELRYDELRRLPRRSTSDPIICPGRFEDHARWSGASLSALLDLAGLPVDARSLTLIGADGYESVLSPEEARSKWALLAYEWEGRALPELHGFPVRAALPGLPGNRWVKWLVEIRVE